jgi:hypothetical protein
MPLEKQHVLSRQTRHKTEYIPPVDDATQEETCFPIDRQPLPNGLSPYKCNKKNLSVTREKLSSW